MKKILRTSSILSIVTFTLICTSGCQALLFPFQLLYYVLGTAVMTFFKLLPVAARCLPLLMLVANVEESPTLIAGNDDPASTVYEAIDQQYPNQTVKLDDAQTVLNQAIDQADSSTQTVVMTFDAWATPRQIEQAIREQTGGKKITRLECRFVDGAPLFNDKLLFFTLLDRMSQKGMLFRGFGSLKTASDLFYNEKDA